ncbi:helix-turn-helix domain-containing protein, partial [bacterium]|nr:helix-turn-helix domain-containing protein [bacterium]
MSIRQLAVRTELSKTSVASIESSEAKGKVQLDSLNKLAEGLNCRLVYALVPKTSLAQS